MGLRRTSMECNPHPDAHVLAQEGYMVPLAPIATVYTNLTPTVYLVVSHNNSLLNCKGFLWIAPHVNITSSPIGKLQTGSLHQTTLTIVGTWFNFTTTDSFYSIRLRQISNAMDIEEIADDVEAFTAEVAYITAISWIVQGTIGAILSAALVGRWKMATPSR